MRTPNKLTASRRGTARYRVAALVGVAAAAGLALLAAAQPAAAGTYRAVQCNNEYGSGHGDGSYSRTSPHYAGRAACRAAGLTVDHEPGHNPTAANRRGAWSFAMPSGSELVRMSARVIGVEQAGHRPELVVGMAGAAARAVPGVRGALHSVSWSGAGGRTVTARLRCARNDTCGAGRDAELTIRRLNFSLRDAAAPTLGVGGALLRPGSRRGAEQLDTVVADTGGGVRSATVEVNGTPLAARTLDCALASGIALRLRPCPADARPAFAVATTAAPFRQGPNQVRVCAADFAPDNAVNRSCQTHNVRIDNLCPVSEVAGSHLSASFAGGSAREGVVQGERASVRGRLTDSAGRPVADGRVCVATRDRVTGAPERVIASPATDAEGRFRVRLPAGPSRAVRVAHWPDDDVALERSPRLNVRARPRLRLRPLGRLRNGDRLRFRVDLANPNASARRVIVQARAPHRWVDVASGRSNARGTYRGSYRFRSTTGKRTYRFRALVPPQHGYPYLPGRSEVRRVTVRP